MVTSYGRSYICIYYISTFSVLFYLTYLSGPGEPITRLADADVEAELPDPQVPHGVLGLILSSLNHLDLSEIRSEIRRLLESSAQVRADGITSIKKSLLLPSNASSLIAVSLVVGVATTAT